MNRTLKLFIVVLYAGAAFLTSCKKSDKGTTNDTTTTTDKTQVNNMFSGLRDVAQTYTVMAGYSKRVWCADSTFINFYPNSFKDKNGKAIDSQVITIQVMEMYKVGSMIANHSTTATSTGVLTSGGQIYISATLNGNEVFPNKYGIGFKQRASSTSPMELYYGNTHNPDSAVTWVMDTTGKTGAIAQNTINVSDPFLNFAAKPYYQFDSCTNFKLINCAHPYDATSAFIHINMVFRDASFTPNNTTLYICYPLLGVVSFMPAYSYSPSTKTIQYTGWAPVGPPCKLILTSKVSTTYYYLPQVSVVSDNMNDTLPAMPVIALDSMKRALIAL